MRQRRFNLRVYPDKVDRTRACRGADAKIITLREHGIERTESIRPGIVATGDVCLGAESWFQRRCRESVTGFRCHTPCPDICGTKAAKLPKRFVVEIPTRCPVAQTKRKPLASRFESISPTVQREPFLI